MKLRNAAKFFDDTKVFDGYSSEYLFKCQFSSFNDSNAVGSTSTRRILSVAPDVEIPQRRVIQIFDDRWLVGDGNPDSFKDRVIRQSFNMKKVNALVTILSPGAACLGSAGPEAYSQRIYFKDTVNASNNAEYDPFWNFFFAPGEPVDKGRFLRVGPDLFRVRSSYSDLGGWVIAQSDEVDAGPVDATFEDGLYNPLADEFSSDPITTKVLFLDFTKAYNYVSKASEREAPGDLSAYVKASAITPKVGKTFLVGDVKWRIVSAQREDDAWLMHVRRA